MAEEPRSLRDLFTSAKSQKEALESGLSSDTDEYREKVNATITKLEECQQLISKLSLFSPNETLDDISTADLQYLTINYLLAEVLQRTSSSEREATLRQALGAYEKYLTQLDEYGLLSKGEKELFDQYSEHPANFSLAPQNDPAARRHVKVARFREEKELKERLSYLSQHATSLQSDDDTIRKLYLAELKLYVHQTFQALDLISQELAILSQMRNLPQRAENELNSDLRTPRSPGAFEFSERLDAPLSQLSTGGRGGPLLSPKGKPLQPFTLTDRRTELQRGVFRPGHNLPTMSIDEYLEEERRRGGIIEGGEQPQKEIDEDDMDRTDQETMKARAWDEFKEANPRGSGNTLNRG